MIYVNPVFSVGRVIWPIIDSTRFEPEEGITISYKFHNKNVTDAAILTRFLELLSITK